MSNLKLSNDSGIYMITCTANGKIYIGSANRLHGRWGEHKRKLRHRTHENDYLQKAWDKYGEKAFTITVLEKCSVDTLVEREQFYLDQWQPFRERGFNIGRKATAAMQGRTHSPETRAKMSNSHKGRARTGYARSIWTPESRAKLSESLKGKSHPQSEETRAKISASLKGRKLSPETCAKMSASRKGVKRSPETRAKMSEAQKQRSQGCERVLSERKKAQPKIRIKRIHSQETRTKMSIAHIKHQYVISHIDGRVIQTDNLREFCRQHNLNHGAMYHVVAGRRRQFKGWTVQRIESEIEYTLCKLLFA